jgi:two-component system, OmpR family, response regulator QseB
MRLLLVEDDTLVGDALASVLRVEGYAVDWMLNSAHARAAFQQADYELTVLDISLPDGSGLDLVREFKRQRPRLATLLLTARDAVEDRVVGLDSGADDYLVKPFEFPELLARLRALRRRTSQVGDPCVEHGEIQYNPALHRVTLAGEVVDVPRRELALLALFFENRGKVMSREFIHGQMYAWSDDIHSNTVEVYVHNLRRLFGSQLIRTIRGVGYVVDAPAD